MNPGGPLDQWLSDPSRVGATGLLILMIGAFYKVLILPKQTHDAAMAQVVQSHREAVSKLEADLQRERAENERLEALLSRNVDMLEKAINAVQKAQHAFDRAHQFRGAMFAEREKGTGQ